MCDAVTGRKDGQARLEEAEAGRCSSHGPFGKDNDPERTVVHLETMPPADLAAVIRYLREHREAGLTWWVEALGWWRCDPSGAMARMRQGPPLLAHDA